MPVDNPPFAVVAGDDVTLIIPIKNPNLSPADIGGAEIEFGYATTGNGPALNSDRPSAKPSIGTWRDPKGVLFQTAEISLSQAETKQLTVGINYFWACRITLGQERETVARGSFKATPIPLS